MNKSLVIAEFNFKYNITSSNYIQILSSFLYVDTNSDIPLTRLELLAGAGVFSLCHLQTGSRAHTASYSVGCGRALPWG
jgi:hypothetical protein